ncbi:MotA/TolQ/ExbB proton channel family protein [Membranihabitans marinus]|uniref:MotA/TolQ/ExbB proton channel family protein n=1 Tax=Membranihabitans marinus TaxID=1227546 RepID=UPI001F2B7CFA|nr:MotA/TolQ/ExbB proton channel family protein [Membranihabitans marinus]
MNPILFILLQAPNVQLEEEVTIERQSLFQLISESGWIGILIVLLLLAMFVVALYLFVERYSAIKRAGKLDDNFINNIRASVQAGNIMGAKALCQSNNSPAARMIEKGIMRIGKPLTDINASIENAGNLELFRLEKNLSTLASISGAAPMIGFFGTVTGMILAFYEMATAENVTPDVLAGGIYQALITTAFGLFVGIFAFIAYNLLVSNVEKVVYKMERTSVEFMDLLQEPVNS